MFTGIGRLRIAAAGGPATVILTIVFPYPATDRPFTEELTGKIPRFRGIAREYFGGLSPDELVPLDEDRAKSEILGRLNRELQLGQIDYVLFNDLMVLE
jgi:flagellar basal body-associated protein FliL